MEHVFSRKLELDDGDEVEVDRLSFTSFNDSEDDDLYMSVRESPCGSNSTHDDLEILSMQSEHRCNPYITDSNSTVFPASLVNSVSEKLNGLVPEEQIYQNLDCWYENLYVDNLPPLPKVVSYEPYWRSIEKDLKVLRQRDAEISKDLEQTNLSIYSTYITLCALEEARWLNDVSKDPELSRLVHEIDQAFPLAVNSSTHLFEQQEAVSSSASVDESNAYLENSDDKTIATFSLDRHNITFNSNCINRKGFENYVRSSTDGVDAIVLRRMGDTTWDEICYDVLRRFIKQEPARDNRISTWMNDLIDHIDKLISIPSNLSTSEEIVCDGQVVKLRGSTEWAPPRDAWIFTLRKNDSIKTLLKTQKFRCAGCGIRVEKEYTKRVRYCDYYGKVFCQCCHQGAKTVIPARILHTWNFNEFPVCDRALRFLSQAYDQPAIHVSTVAPSLVEKIRVLKHVIIMRKKLSYMWEFIKICSFAEDYHTKSGKNLKTLFTSLDRHLLHDIDVFSLSDLSRVYNKGMSALLEPIVYYGKYHIESCQLCMSHGHICYLCGDQKQLLFPYQQEKVFRCDQCEALAHIKCQAKYNRKSSDTIQCPKCARIEKTRERQRIISVEDT